MTQRLNNDFQFVDVGRREPAKKDIHTRKHEFVEIYEPYGQKQAAEQSHRCLSAATHTANGSARYITSFPTG